MGEITIRQLHAARARVRGSRGQRRVWRVWSDFERPGHRV